MLRGLSLVLGAAVLMAVANTHAAEPKAENILVMDLEHGRVLIEVLPEAAPDHVERIRKLTRQGFFDGLVFHRVIDNFVAQTGDPTGTGRGGSDLPNLEAEFNDVSFERGVVGMARGPSPDSANSQWFITLADASHLTGQYTAWGRVIDGMSAVEEIKSAPPGRQSGMVDGPDRIVRMRVAVDIPNFEMPE